MCAEAAKTFLTKVEQDSGLKSRVKAIKGDENAVLNGMVKLGAEQNLQFTTEELKLAAKSCQGKLSEAELETVAGGRCKVVILTVGYCTD